jgi:UDP:flavonoid glycosyltransferase YjiC (YdhE family)
VRPSVLAYTSPPAGHVYPAIPMLLELEQRAYRVTVRTGSRHVGPLQAAGLNAAPIDAAIERVAVDDWCASGALAALGRLLRVFEARAALEVADLRAAIRNDGPSALLIDINCLGAMMVAESSGLPWAVYCPHPPALRSRDAPPFGPGLTPRGPLTAIRDPFVRRRADRIWNAGLQQLNVMRLGLGSSPSHIYTSNSTCALSA